LPERKGGPFWTTIVQMAKKKGSSFRARQLSWPHQEEEEKKRGEWRGGGLEGTK